MTREEVLKSLTTIRDGYLRLIDEKVDSGKVVGTDGLRGEWKSNTPLDDIYRHSAEALDMAIKVLEQNPKRIKGSWLHVGHDEYQCSCCGFSFIADDTEDENFCQFCGADMRGEQNE